MKYLAILFSLLFALSGSMVTETVSATTEEPIMEPELADIAGTVAEITEDTLTIDTETNGQVLVHLTDTTLWEGETPTVGAYVHVVYNGVMTRSLPPQITALRVGCYAYTGTISEIDEEFFMLQVENDLWQVNAEAEKLANLTVGLTVTVYSNGAMTMSLPPQIYGELILATESVE